MDIKEQFKKFLDDNFLFDTSNLITDEKERNYRKENSPVWLAFKSAYESQQAEITRLKEQNEKLREALTIISDTSNDGYTDITKELMNISKVYYKTRIAQQALKECE